MAPICLPISWREKQLITLKKEEGVKQVLKERGGLSEIEFEVKASIGGQTKLEGADYFWFFTKLMMGTAVLFVLVAFYYKPKEYLQEEDAEGEDQEKAEKKDDSEEKSPLES